LGRIFRSTPQVIKQLIHPFIRVLQGTLGTGMLKPVLRCQWFASCDERRKLCLMMFGQVDVCCFNSAKCDGKAEAAKATFS
jgi:hypothetical protein